MNVPGKAQCRGGGRGRFGTEEHPTGGKTKGRIQPAMSIFVSASADGMVGGKLGTAEAVAHGY